MRPSVVATALAALLLTPAPASAHHSNKSEHAAEILSLSASKKKGQVRQPDASNPQGAKTKHKPRNRQPRAK